MNFRDRVWAFVFAVANVYLFWYIVKHVATSCHL